MSSASRRAAASESGPRALETPLVRARRTVFFGAVAASTLLASAMMLDIMRASGVTVLEIVLLSLFVPTFAWISVSFWNAVTGFALLVLRRDPVTLGRTSRVTVDSGPLVGRTALVMPAHNEDPRRLAAGLLGVVTSLEETGQAGHFDVHLLSDTTDPDIARAEEDAWRRLRRLAPRPGRLHYRRRDRNLGRKAGNIADFLERWADRYDFMVVLDADSFMSGATVVELVRTMQDNPDAGLIQTVPLPSGQDTLFGRFVQLAAALYSPLLATGQAFWQGDAANYWGHNAIVRVRPFVEHARLPVLQGRPPLGGAILSHDFVEAAWLRRAGWKVFLLPTLGGSHEEVPADVVSFARRDRRWAQGSLQHLRLLGTPGLHPMSRLHFVLGAMGYVSSVLWLLLLVGSTLYVLAPGLSARSLWDDPAFGTPIWSAATSVAELLPLLALTAVVLFLPKALGLAVALCGPARAFGGRARLLLSGLLEALFSVVIAPVMMTYHAASVCSIVAGRDVGWGRQQRSSRLVPWREAARSAGAATVVGAGWAAMTLSASPIFTLWLSPIFVGLVLAVPLVRWTSRSEWGRALRRHRILLVPSEAARDGSLERGTEAGAEVAAGVDTPSRTDYRMHEIERALFDLRRGRPLLVESADPHVGGALCLAVEGVDPARLVEIQRLGSGPARLVVTRLRAEAMGLETSAPGSWSDGVSLGLREETAREVFRMSSAPEHFDFRRLDPRPASEVEAAALSLVRMGRLLPAVVSVAALPDGVPELREALASSALLRVGADGVRHASDHAGRAVHVTHVSDAPVPLEESEDARFMLFREANGVLEHVAILIGHSDRWPDPVPVRLHSACLTGDLFGSLKCDCGDQLRGSLRSFARGGGGVLLYLHQEGRGIGLGNKLRAYSLQQGGLDTVDADGVLGFGVDERRYDAAVGMLLHLGIERVRILTNNPEKVRALEEGGIVVTSREPLHGTLNRYNLPYVRAKVQRAGHWLGDMLGGGAPEG